MLIDLYTKDGNKQGQVELNEEIFNIEPNEHAMHQAVGSTPSKLPPRHKKKQSFVRKYPVAVKSHGDKKDAVQLAPVSSRSPVWVGGGTVHGPKPTEFLLKLPKKLKKLARKSALSLRTQESNLLVIEDFRMEQIKTQEFANVLRNLKIEEKTLVLLPQVDYNIYMSARNIKGITVQPVDKISTYDILKHKKLLLFKGAIETIEKNF